MPELLVAAVAIAALLVGAVLGYAARRIVAANAVKHAESYTARIMAEARAKQKEIVLEGKDEALQLQRAAEEEAREKRIDLQRQERMLLDRAESLERKIEAIERREETVEQRQAEIETARQELGELRQRQLGELERVSSLSVAEARQTLISQIVDEAQAEASQRVRDIERHAVEAGEERARRVLTTVMQRIAGEHTSEATVTVVHLPNEEMKGRIIGREGRNIRALEQATGVDLIIDDTPEAVVLSGFDPVRREVARMTLTKLISDGRIHPGRIEETVAKARAEIEVVMRQAGEQAAYDAGVPGLHPELIKLLGRLKYRTSYGQNVLDHCIETARLAGLLAAEIGANVGDSKKGGLLHDIGKAVDHEVEGPHAAIGADIASKLGVNAIGLQRHRGASPGGGAGDDRGDRGPDRGRDQRVAAGCPRARASTTTSSVSTTSSRSRSASPASSVASPSRRAARSGSWCAPRTSTTSRPAAWRVTWSSASRSSSSTRARSR